MPTSRGFSEAERVARLDLPAPGESAPVVLDTDTYNEVDDQFALVHAVGATDLRAVHAAPFHNQRSEGPGDGMEKSYEEADRLLDLLGSDVPLRRGARAYLGGPDEPVESAATADLAERARATDGPLYVVAIGASTNVASALLADPGLAEEIVVVWLAGQPHGWPSASEFNLRQDPHAARVLFDSGVPLVHVPCQTVAEGVTTSVPELRAMLDGRGEVAEFLLERFVELRAERGGENAPAWSKEIWDVAATACVACPDAVQTSLVHSPVLTRDLTWSHDPDRHFVRVVRHVDRDAVFASVLDALAAAPGGDGGGTADGEIGGDATPDGT